ncbi:osmoprotectant transport system substrate-binding protein [Jatrophihabitans sp. GAS493]|uniref:ABC transporter substrate-binding protein n=1 Tax=Jatrophihabitans sp. GAS493 TaxID=1907575 RepID=UPI000BB6D416|nr:ABC transporter substrate-binding protein [Jatrophihabitans sp. GAS493]SOD71535.1 osmoprotectant transport system substrate-binding protein [Jatrophihabitans sp. GAS493]
MKRISLVAAASVAAALALTACGSSGSSSKTSTEATTAGGTAASAASGPGSLIVGSADFGENVLLANIYADAMAAKGVKITKKLNIGERAAYIPALKDGSIDFIPEYSGSILYYLDPKATAKSPDDVYAALPTAAGSDLSVLKYAAAQDSDTITVTKSTASKYNLKSIADLSSVASKLTLGAPAAFQTRPDGVPALKSVYGVTFGTFTPISASGSITVDSLKGGNIDAADIFSTDPSIAANDFVSLSDPKSMFAAQNIIPLLSASKVTSTITDAANAVSAKLDTATLASLVTKVQVDKQDSDTVAKAWLTSVGLA